ncbi:unnamed protein product [Closterium sp. NIES-65]|nr:unnamed protein product [Closterium sp. NIES-65]
MDRSREAGEQGGVAGGGMGTHQPANPTLPTSSTPSPTTVDPVKAFSIEKFMGGGLRALELPHEADVHPIQAIGSGGGEGENAGGHGAEMSMDEALVRRVHAHAINLNSQQPQWSVDYIRARILEEDLPRQSVERSEEGAGYGVGGGKSGFKKKWKGKNKDNPKEDGGGGQWEVCFYCKKRGHRWRKCYQRPKDWTLPSSSNLHGGKRSGGVMGASGEEKEEEKGGKSEERKAGFFFFVNEGATDLAMAAKLHLDELHGSELTSDHSGGGEQQVSGLAGEEGLEDESARVDSPTQPEPAANAKVTKRSVQRGASPHGQQTATREKRVAAAP